VSAPAAETVRIGPNPGPQMEAVRSSADITGMGGSAGGGKSFSTMFRFGWHAARYRGYYGAVFRREMPQVLVGGGLWEESMGLYPIWGAKPNLSTHDWRFPNRSLVQFRGLQHAKDVIDYQGAQFAEFAFEEATHFEESQFWYMFSRLRSKCGMQPRCYLTFNPDPDSWVARMVDWWIGEDGYAIPERAGKKRYFARDGDELVWGDTADEVRDRCPHSFLRPGSRPYSFRFIPARLADNPKGDPTYESRLEKLTIVERERLLGGNWKIRAAAGMYYKKPWFEIVDYLPSDILATARGWDLAATQPSKEYPNPDWTRGVKASRHQSGMFFVHDVRSLRDTPHRVDELVTATAHGDGRRVTQAFWQDPGAAGKAEASRYVRMLAGYDVRIERAAEDKETYAKGPSAQAEAGHIKLLRGAWNEAFLNELEAFPTKGVKDDQVDGLSRAFLQLTSTTPMRFVHIPGA
jgi:predicted phage terminase large subunit-like protein